MRYLVPPYPPRRCASSNVRRYDTVVSTFTFGGNAPYNRLVMAPDGLSVSDCSFFRTYDQ